jgi:hypothetical protein
MRRITCLPLAITVIAMAFGASSASGASPAASCSGVLVSSLAGQPQVVATLTRQFHEEAKAAGLPPGFFDVAGAQLHAGGVEECLKALGP